MSSVKLPLSFISYSSEQEGADIQKITKTISSLASDDVLIKVAYASINPMDGKFRIRNMFNLPLPLTLGFDFSGIIVALGKDDNGTYNDDGLVVGDEVFGVEMTGGCFAEYVRAKRYGVAKKGSIPFKEASTYGIAYGTTYEGLRQEDDINKRKGQSIYLPGGCGGLGHFAVQLAKQAGMIVFTSGSKPESAALANQLGVDHYIDYKKQDVVKEILSLTNNRGVDIAWDPTYQPSSFNQSSAVVARGGLWTRLADRAGAADATEAVIIAKNRGANIGTTDYGRYWWAESYIDQRRSLLAELFKDAITQYEKGAIKPYINKVIPAEPATLQRALDDILAGKSNVGKMVFEVNPTL